MLKYEIESCVSAAFDTAMEGQYRRCVRAVADSIVEKNDMPWLYSEHDVDEYIAGAVMSLLWMTDNKSGGGIEHDIRLAVAEISAGLTE